MWLADWQESGEYGDSVSESTGSAARSGLTSGKSAYVLKHLPWVVETAGSPGFFGADGITAALSNPRLTALRFRQQRTD